MFESLSLAPSHWYCLFCCLQGHTSGVWSLSINKLGILLVSAGLDGLRIWNIETGRQAACSMQAQHVRGPLGCLMWISLGGESNQILCYGTGFGYLCFWRLCREEFPFEEICVKTTGSGQEIMCVTWEATQEGHAWLVTGSRSRSIQTWVFDQNGSLTNQFSVKIESTLPIGVFFTDNITKDVIVFGQTDGTIHTLSGKDGSIISTMEVGVLMGSVSIGAQKSLFVIDNATTGFSLYSIESRRCIQTFPTSTPVSSLPKQVAFAEGDLAVVGGSDHSSVYVFDKKTGTPLDVLQHSKKGLVQTVAAHHVNDTSTVVSATSLKNKEATIMVWRQRSTPTQTLYRFASLGTAISRACQALVLLWIIAMAFNYFALSKRTEPVSYTLQPTTARFRGIWECLQSIFLLSPDRTAPAIAKAKHYEVREDKLIAKYLEVLVDKAIQKGRDEEKKRSNVIVLGPI